MFEISLTSCHFTPRYAYIFTRLAVKTSRPQYVKEFTYFFQKTYQFIYGEFGVFGRSSGLSLLASRYLERAQTRRSIPNAK